MSDVSVAAVAAPTATPAPAPAAEREEIALAPAHSEYLKSEASFGSLAALAFRVSLAAPLFLFGIFVGITKLVSRVPLIGWLLAIYGLIGTVAAVVAGIAAIPVVFLVLLPMVLFGRRAKLNRDVSAARAVRQSGTFQVIEGAGGGALVSTLKKFRLSKTELDGLKPALVEGEEFATLSGTVVSAANAGDLLAAYDESGRQLIGVAQA
ncbi:MAG: hypothetical protein ACJ768_10970 [Gaiellaceae bacterium]